MPMLHEYSPSSEFEMGTEDYCMYICTATCSDLNTNSAQNLQYIRMYIGSCCVLVLFHVVLLLSS